MIEKDIKKLEELAEKMESQEISLDESLKLFAEGVALVKKCTKKLETAELKVSEILKDTQTEETGN